MFVFAAACSDPGGARGVAPHHTSATTNPTASTAPVPPQAEPWFGLEAGFEDFTALLADLDSDGHQDAIVSVFQGGIGEEGVAFGPLRGAVFPRDFDVPLTGGTGFYGPVVGIGEYTGGPPVDVIVNAASGWYVAPGPWDGSLTPRADWVPFVGDPFHPFDVDRDGVLDQVVTAGDERTLEVRYGPVERFTGPPDVTIDLCPDEESRNAYMPQDIVHAPGDLDSDGSFELSVAPHGSYYGAPCGGFTVELPPTGHVDPFDPASGAALGVTTLARPIGDWNADGLVDFVEGTPADGCCYFSEPAPAILLSPITWTGGTSAGAVPLSALFVAPLDVDVNGDGQPELLAFHGGTLGWIPSDPAVAAAEVSLGAGWLLGSAFVEDGRALLPFHDATTAYTVDLGPGSAP